MHFFTLRKILKKTIDYIVVTKVDCIICKLKDFLDVLELLEKYDIGLISLKENVDTNSLIVDGYN